jgi:hypothetical protein
VRALRVFAPQVFGLFATTGFATGVAAAGTNAVVIVPMVILGLASFAVTLVTTLTKAFSIDSERDWERLDKRGCSKCRKLAAELDETRGLLSELTR